MNYCNRKDGDFWKRFRVAGRGAIPVWISDVRVFSAAEVLDSLGARVGEYDGIRKYSREKDRLIIDEHCFVKSADCQLSRFLQLAYSRLLNSAETQNDRDAARMYESWLAKIPAGTFVSHCRTEEVNKDVLVAIKDLFSAESLWFDQKVRICQMAAELVFFPDRWTHKYVDHTKESPDWRRYYAKDHEWQHVCECGWWHHYDLTNDEWESGCGEQIADALADAYLREMRELDYSKLDFSCFRELFGNEYEAVVSCANDLTIANEVNKMNRAIKNLRSGIKSRIERQRTFAVKMRRAVHETFRTCDEAIDVTICDAQLSSRVDREVKICSFFEKMLG